MNETLEKQTGSQTRWLFLGMGYVLIVMVIGGYINYMEPYDSSPVVYPNFGDLLLWTSLYAPLVFPIFGKWQVKDLGFSINPSVVLASICFGFLCSFMQNMATTWYGTFAEAFSRTGEEFFFRGFLFFLLIKIFEKKRRPWLWAVIGSAAAFSLIHTQTFQPSFLAKYGDTPIIFSIVQRFLDIFISFGIVFGLVRHWTKSILPGAIAHSLNKGGILTLPFVLIIYAVIAYWAHTRNESVVSGFEQSPKVAI